MRPRALIVLLLLLTAPLAACSRSFPSTLPRGSAASLDAAEAPAPAVGVALRGDPPLPGEPTDGWPGLDASDGAADGTRLHGGHHAP